MEEQQQEGRFQRPTFKGDWKCSECGTPITELPFKPSEGRPVYCKECFRSKRPQRDFRN